MKKTSNLLIITGASCELAQEIALKFSMDDSFEIAGISRRPLRSDLFNYEIVTDIFDSNELSLKLAKSIIFTEYEKVIAVCCTGPFIEREYLHNLSDEDFDLIFRGNVKSFFNIYKALLPFLKGETKGTFITFGSISDRYNYPGMALYNSAKLALKNLVKSICNEQVENGMAFIHINLSTLNMEKEHKFTKIDNSMLLECKDVAHQVYSSATTSNTLTLYKELDMLVPYSGYFTEGYEKRVPNKMNKE